jgi:16S rRNA (adenine1518-N6/adenine1519-N6)-dimethyltransferase
VSLTRAQSIALLEQAGLKPKRKLGQNFVVDANTLARIVRLGRVTRESHVIEIGAGLGALTQELLSTQASVTAVEIDSDLVQILRNRPELSKAHIVEGDALRMDFNEVVSPSRSPWVLIANLPYNVATPLVLRVLEDVPQIQRMLVMVQAEVGERIAASPGDDAYGAVSLRVAYHGTASVAGRVPPTVFVPRPKVDSVLVSIERSSKPAVDPELVSEDEIFALVRQAFGQRRKMLRRSLASVVSPEAFEAAGVLPTARPEELDVRDFGRLALSLK